MSRSAILTLGLGPDQLGALWSDGANPPADGHLDAFRVAAIGDGRPTAGDNAADRSAQDHLAARRLDGLLASPGMSVLRAWITRMREGAGSEPMVVAIDARTEKLRGLPWELLTFQHEEESPLAGGVFVRLGGRPVAVTPAPGLEVWLWNPAVGDPTSVALAEGVRASCESLSAVRFRLVHPELAALPSPLPNHRRVLHVVCNGAETLDQHLARGSTAAKDRLGPLIAAADLVILEACGAAPPLREVDALGRFAGAAAVFVPGAPLSREAVPHLAPTLYRALATGASIATAVTAARKALQATQRREDRWWMPVLFAGDPALVTRPLVGRATLGFDRPTGDASAEAVLGIAARLAAEDGYFGLEHVAAGLAEHADPILLRAFAPIGDRRLRGSPDPHPPPTRPLKMMFSALRPGFHTATLAQALMGCAWILDIVGTNAVARLFTKTSPGGHIARPPSPRRPPAPLDGLGLLVESGPEDGRLIELLSRGAVVGRWDPAAPDETETRLYHTGPSDLLVGYRHVVYDGGRRVVVSGRTRRNGIEVDGHLGLVAGDTLRLGGGTYLRVL